MMNRRHFLKASGTITLLSNVGNNSLEADVPVHRWDDYDFGHAPYVKNRLNQGPFGIEQDEGWRNIGITSASDKHIKNFGLGLTAYTLEENGPSVSEREGKDTLMVAHMEIWRIPMVTIWN